MTETQQISATVDTETIQTITTAAGKADRSFSQMVAMILRDWAKDRPESPENTPTHRP